MLLFPQSRFRKTLFTGVILILGLVSYTVLHRHPSRPYGSLSQISISRHDRILIMAPHPDDEILSSAGIIINAVTNHIPLHIVFLTFGDFNEWAFAVQHKHPVLKPSAVKAAAEGRHNEAIAASASLGLNATNLTFLGYPDGGTMKIWLDHWPDNAPYHQPLTKANAVPYNNAMRPGAPYTADNIITDIQSVITNFNPTIIIVSHPADFHPDHRALYLYTWAAVLQAKLAHPPRIITYLTHYKNWPYPRGLKPALPLNPPDSSSDWSTYPLTITNETDMLIALKKHTSQFKVAHRYLSSFVRTNHLFQRCNPQSLSATNSITYNSSPALNTADAKTVIGIEKRRVFLDSKNRLCVSMTFSRRLADVSGIILYLYGFRDDTPFAAMPKIKIRISSKSTKVFNNGHRVKNNGISIIRGPTELTTKIEQKKLKSPQKLFLGVRTYIGDLPVNRQTWQLIEISPDLKPKKTN